MSAITHCPDCGAPLLRTSTGAFCERCNGKLYPKITADEMRKIEKQVRKAVVLTLPLARRLTHVTRSLWMIEGMHGLWRSTSYTSLAASSYEVVEARTNDDDDWPYPRRFYRDMEAERELNELGWELSEVKRQVKQ